jgi:hypothetical protein
MTMNPSPSPVVDIRHRAGSLGQPITAVAVLLLCLGLWLGAVTTFATAPTPFEQGMITVGGKIVFGSNLTLLGLLLVRIGLGLAGRWRAWRVVRPVFVGLCLCAMLGDALVALLMLTDHLSALTPAQEAIDNRVVGVATVLLLVHAGMAYVARRPRRSLPV